MPDVSIVARGPSSLKMRFRPGLVGPPLAEDDFATQAEAEAGTDVGKVMSPLRTAQQTTARLPSQAIAEAGEDNTKISTPLRVTQQTTARLASQDLAEAGADHDKLMSPLRVAQQIDARLASQAVAEAGTDDVDLITSLRTAQAIKVRAEGADYTPTGMDFVARTLQAKSRDLLSIRDYGSVSQARTAADAQSRVLIASPETNAGLDAAKTREGVITGHMAIGDTASQKIDAHVGLFADEFYLNTGQEVRGVSYTVRNKRTTTDEATLGWDFIPVLGATVVTADTSQFIRGNMKSVVGEFIAQGGVSTSYTVQKAYPFQSLAIIGQGVTVQNYYGLIVNNPINEGRSTPVTAARIEKAYGIYIQQMTGGTTERAGIKFEGNGVGTAIKWANCFVFEDSSGKMNLDLNSQYLVMTRPMTATAANTGANGAPPAQVAGYWRVIFGGNAYKIPYYAD